MSDNIQKPSDLDPECINSSNDARLSPTMRHGYSMCATNTEELPTETSSVAANNQHDLYVPREMLTSLPFFFHHYSPSYTVTEVFASHGTLNALLTQHIKSFQRRAFALWPYPCIGLYEFVKFNLPTYPRYDSLQALLQSGGKFLDLGCCVGQELRYLSTVCKVPNSQLYGVDIRSEFIDLGYDLFLDREHFGANFGVADVFDTSIDSWLITNCAARMDVVHTGYLLHLFEYDKQIEICERILSLLKPRAGVMIVGRSTGSAKPGLFKHPTSGNMFRHNHETFELMWKKVGQKTGRAFDVVCDSYPMIGRFSSGGEVFQELGVEHPLELMFAVTVKEVLT